MKKIGELKRIACMFVQIWELFDVCGVPNVSSSKAYGRSKKFKLSFISYATFRFPKVLRLTFSIHNASDQMKLFIRVASAQSMVTKWQKCTSIKICTGSSWVLTKNRHPPQELYFPTCQPWRKWIKVTWWNFI